MSLSPNTSTPASGTPSTPPPQPSSLLLTKKSLALSLSAPRAPPHASAQRQVLLGRNPAKAAWRQDYSVKKPPQLRQQQHRRIINDDNAKGGKDKQYKTTNDMENDSTLLSAHSYYPHETLRQRFHERLVRIHLDTPSRSTKQYHPHLPAGPELGDALTRTLGVWLPTAWSNHVRDSGGFRRLADSLVTSSVPFLALTQWTATRKFVQLSSSSSSSSSNNCYKRRHAYGAHPRQYIDVYLPPDHEQRQSQQQQQSSSSYSDKNDKQTPHHHHMVFFIHGGAWGSGLPWMYRLCALPFLEQGWAVAIPSYRTYPDGTALDQVQDAEQALQCLQETYPHYFSSNPKSHVTLAGHSSGAHIGLLLLAHRARRQLSLEQEGKETLSLSSSSSSDNKPAAKIDAFVGLSGPYDISHHFDYEAARGVEELSPMKAACGMTRAGFRRNSPALYLLDSLASINENNGSEQNIAATLPRRILLLHAIEDDTVPFTSTAEAARVLRSCGVTQVEELYVGPGTGHQDTVMQLMLGGPTQEAVMAWMLKDVSSSANNNNGDSSTAATATLYQKSKL